MNKMRLTLLAASVSALLGGCSLAPTYYTPDMKDVPAAYKETGTWQTAQPADNQPRGDWWTLYGDTTLDQLVGKLDQANPNLAAALSHYDQAQAVEAEAQSYLLPTVNAVGFDTQNHAYFNQPKMVPGSVPGSPENYRTEFGGLNLNYELDLWGSVRNAVAAQQAGAQAAAADMESVRLSLRANLVNDYISLRGYDEQISLLKAVEVAYQKALTLTQNRFRGGIDSALDVSRAQAQLDSAEAEIVDFIAKRALYEHAIASLVGEPASVFSIASGPLLMKLPEVPIGLPSDLLQRRPDIASAERQVAAANAQIGVARAAYFPTVTLGGLTGFESVNSQQFAIAPTRIWSVGPAAFLPLFDGGLRRAVNRQARDAFDIATDNYRATVLTGFQQVEDNLTLSNDLALEDVRVKSAIQATNHTLTIAMNRYIEGMESYLEVTTAQTEVLQEELQGLILQSRRLQANVNLIRALGGGYIAPKATGFKSIRPEDKPKVGVDQTKAS